MNSASLCSLAGRYNNPFPTRCLASIDFLKIPALAGRYDNPIPTRFLAPIDCLKIPAQIKQKVSIPTYMNQTAHVLFEHCEYLQGFVIPWPDVK